MAQNGNNKEPSDATRNKKTDNYTFKVRRINVKYLKNVKNC